MVILDKEQEYTAPEMIQILDKQSDLLVAILDNTLDGGAVFWGDEHDDNDNNLETFDFQARADVAASEHLTGRNRVLIPGDRPNSWQEFVIFDVFKNNSGIMEVKTNASYLDLTTEPVLLPFDLGATDTETAINYGLSGTDWQPGIIEYGGVRSVKATEVIDRYSYLRSLAGVYDLKLRFRVEVRGNQIIGRYVDLVANLGSFEGKEILLGKDLVGVTRKENTLDVITALVVEGPAQESGQRIRVELKNEEARQRWGRNGKHVWGHHQVDSNNAEMSRDEVIRYGTTELEKHINGVVQWEAEGVSLEHVFGLSHERASKGDKVRLKDISFNPPLYMDARIIAVKRSISDKSVKKFVLGDFIEYSADEVMDLYRQLRSELATKLGRPQVIEIVEDADIIRHPYAPEDPELDQLWIDTSKVPEIMYRWNGTEWIKSSATVPEDIGAVPPEYVDQTAAITQLKIEIGTITSTLRQFGVEVDNFQNSTWLQGLAILTTLNTRRDELNTAGQAVITEINNAIGDNAITQVEMQGIDAQREDYRVHLDALINTIREAQDEIVRQSANEVMEFGERKIFKGGTIPAAADTQELDLWLDARSTPPVWRQFINGSWTKISRTNMADMQGKITGVQITDDSINAEHIAANAITAKHISANVITSNMITTAGLDAGVITYGTMTGITADVGQAGMTAVGTSSASVRFWAGASYANRGTAPFRVTQSGGVVATNLNMTGGNISGGSINIDTNATIGRDLILGEQQSFIEKNIIFNQAARITGGTDWLGHGIEMNADGFTQMFADVVTPYGTRVQNGTFYPSVDHEFESDVHLKIHGPLDMDGPEWTKSGSERGYMGCGAAQDNLAGVSGASFIGVGVNFRTKKNFAPSSVGTYQYSSNIGNSGQLNTTDISREGFWLYLTIWGSATGYIYWRGEYLA